MRCVFVSVFLLFSVFGYTSNTHEDSLSHQQKRKLAIGGLSTSILYGSSMYLLYDTWYKDYTSSRFHFFNDLNEWKGMDKLGHITSSFFIAQWLQSIQELGGVNDRKAILRSVLVPIAFMTTIEVFDGFSSGWGFSISDMVANSIGFSAFYAQNKIFGEQRFLLKYSFSKSPYSVLRPNLLGNSLAEQMLKDYNGQTYWVSYPLKNLWPTKENNIPQWLHLSLGYGVDGLVGARTNSWTYNQQGYSYLQIPRIHQWYLSFDIDLKKLPIKGKAWQFFTSSIRWIKIPAPVISFNRIDGFGAHPLKW